MTAMARCPVCGRHFQPAGSAAMPFCGERCRRIDLCRWLDEKYAVPGEPAEEPEPLENGKREPDRPSAG